MSRRDDFVRVRGAQLELHGQPYRFAGVNLWYAAYLGLPGDDHARARLQRELDHLRQLGVTNLRLLAAAEASPHSPLKLVFQSGPGEYNETLLCGLDYALDQIGRRGMKAVLYLNNQWEWSGGMASYVEWATGDTRPTSEPWPATLRFDDRFYSVPEARRYYLDYVRMLVSRVNTANGKPYKDDPAIMSWQLANEPRAGDAGDLPAIGPTLLDWADESSRLLRALAPHHLISTGSEGVTGSNGNREFYEQLHALPTIDYLTAHVWPFNWFWYRPLESATMLPDAIDRTHAYLDTHVAVAQSLGKPLVLEEFGLPRDQGQFDPAATTESRDAYFGGIFERLLRGARDGSPLCGLNLWSWSGEAVPRDSRGALWQPGEPFGGDNGLEPQGLNSIFATDRSTLALLQGLNRELDQLATAADAKTLSE